IRTLFAYLFSVRRLPHRHLHSFPTRRSSDLSGQIRARCMGNQHFAVAAHRLGRRLRQAHGLTGLRPLPITILGAHELAISRFTRSEEHTSELQSRENLVCRLLLEKKKARVVT